MGERLVRVSATGVDGVGKDTAWRNAKGLLPPNLRILKIGKPSSYVLNGNEVFVDIETSKFLDNLHSWADLKKSKILTSAVNALYVVFQWRFQEPFWTHKIKPDLIFSLRDGYVDPATYAPFYMSNTLGRLSIPNRINALHLMHDSPFRDLTIFLDIDPAVAVTRIEERMKREAVDTLEIIRPKWKHQHENIQDLTQIRQEFLAVLNHLRDARRTQISCVDANGLSKEMAGRQLATEIIASIS